jgi:hypothetical protein
MRWLVLLRWTFRGEHKTGLIIHANDQREAEERVYTLLPPTFFRAANREIAICPTDKLLQALPTFIENIASPAPEESSSLATLLRRYEESGGASLVEGNGVVCSEAV